MLTKLEKSIIKILLSIGISQDVVMYTLLKLRSESEQNTLIEYLKSITPKELTERILIAKVKEMSKETGN